jgi:hypothetical protein
MAWHRSGQEFLCGKSESAHPYGVKVHGDFVGRLASRLIRIKSLSGLWTLGAASLFTGAPRDQPNAARARAAREGSLACIPAEDAVRIAIRNRGVSVPCNRPRT